MNIEHRIRRLEAREVPEDWESPEWIAAVAELNALAAAKSRLSSNTYCVGPNGIWIPLYSEGEAPHASC